MILVDANLLIYAYAREMPQHEAARTWLEAQHSASRGAALALSARLCAPHVTPENF